MEASMQFKQLRRLAKELEQCGSCLSSNISKLDALCESRYSKPLEKNLQAQSAFLKKQAGALKDMAAVLEQAVYLYERTEESIIQEGEADVRKYDESLRAVSLSDMAHVPVKLV